MPVLKRKEKRRAYLPVKVDTGATSDQGFYNSQRWRKVSIAHRYAWPLCEVADHLGLLLESNVVDHIIPIEHGGARFDERNFCAMSHYWHNVKRGKESHRKILVQYKDTAEGRIPANRKEIFYVLTGKGGGENP